MSDTLAPLHKSSEHRVSKVKKVSCSEFFTLPLVPAYTNHSRLFRAREVFNSLDVDGDGSLTLKEFVTGYLRSASLFPTENRRGGGGVQDRSNTVTISPQNPAAHTELYNDNLRFFP